MDGGGWTLYETTFTVIHSSSWSLKGGHTAKRTKAGQRERERGAKSDQSDWPQQTRGKHAETEKALCSPKGAHRRGATFGQRNLSRNTGSTKHNWHFDGFWHFLKNNIVGKPACFEAVVVQTHPQIRTTAKLMPDSRGGAPLRRVSVSVGMEADQWFVGQQGQRARTTTVLLTWAH